VPSVTAQDIIVNSMIEVGALAQGETPASNDAAYVFGKANRLSSQWSTRSLFIWTVRSDRYTLIPSQRSYTIGRAPGADFVADRPLGPREPGNGIKNANIVLTSVSPEVRVPLRLLDDDEWASIWVLDVPTTLPVALYNDGAYPNSTLYLWGWPTQANDLELFTNQQLPQFPDLVTPIELATGYEEAFILTLAESIGPAFGQPITADLRENARRARAAIQSLNSSSPKIGTDVPEMPNSGPRSTFNYRSGTFQT